MRQTNVRGTLSLRGFRKLRTGAIVATGVILLGLGFLAPTVSANEQDGVWVARTVAEVKADIQNIDNLSHYTIKWGDTLSAISGATGLSVDSLVEINRIANRDLIFVNNKLYFSEEAFLKDGNTEVKRQRVSIDNSGSCQSYEVETKTNTVTGEQTTTVKQTTPVVVETPAVSAAKAEESISPALKSETPVTVAPKAETREEVSNAPSLGATTSADSGESSSVTDNAPSNTGTTNQPLASNPSSEVSASSESAPKVEEPVAPAPKTEEPVAPTPKTEEPATPAPKAEEPVAPTPKSEEPSAPAPKAEEPTAPGPKVEEPVATTPKAEEPVATTPKAEEPVAPAPKAEEPTTPAPKVEEPAGTAPKVEEPVAPAPKAEDPAAGTTPKADEPAAGTTPKAEEPVAGTTPKAEEPSAGTTPKVEEPAGTTPKAEEPSADTTPKADEPAPKADEPVAPAPKAEAPATPAPKAEEPTAPAPKVEEPATPAPKVEEPSAGTTPKAEEPAAPAPKAEEPVAPAPKAEEPVAPAPKAEEPTTPAPKVEEPAAPAPKVEEPSATTPKADEPSAPAPKAEAPAASAPKADEPSAPSPKAEEPTTPAPKAEEPTAPAPKVEEPATPAPKAEEPTAPAPKVEEPTASAPKDDESASSVESPSTGNHSEESGASSTTPTVDSTSSPVTPSEEAPVTSGDTNSTTQPAGESGKSETPSESSNTPSADATNESGNSESSSSVTDDTTSNVETTEQPETSAPKTEAPAPKVDDPATPEPKTEEEKLLEETKQDSIRENIDAVVNIKLAEIEKIENSDEKEKLKAKLYELRKNAVDDIKNAKDEEEALILTEKHQNIINSLEISGEKYTKPNFDKDNLSNGRNDGTTIEGGSTAIGHGSGEAPSGATQPASAEGTDNSSAPTAQPQPETTSSGTSSFRNAPSVQARARRVARSTSEPDGTVNISYNFAEMPDIHGFLSDPGEDNTVTIPAGTSEAQAKELVKEKIQAKIKDLAARGYYVKNDIIFEQDTTVKNYNYVVTFTKEATGTSGFRMAPAVQPRASRNRRSLEQPAPQKVKVNVFYNFDKMKDIAGFLGDINGTSLEIAEGLSNEQVKAAVKSQVDAKKEELSKRGYTFKEDYVYQANGKDYNYVVTFTKETTGTSGFRMAPAVQPRASRNRRSLEQPASQKVKVNVFYNFDKMKDIAGFLGDIDGTSIEIAEGSTNEQVKAAVKSQVDAKKEELSKRGYSFKEDYVYQANGKDYNYVVTFSKATK